MATDPSPEDQHRTTKMLSGQRQEIFYRGGLVLQVLGVALLAVLYPMGDPFYSVGIMLFDAGVLLSAGCLMAEKPWTKKIVVASVLAGIVLQVYGLYAPEEHAGSLIIGGIGIVCVGAAGLAGFEAARFRYREGWLLLLVFPSLALANLLCKENCILNSIGFSVLFLLLLSLLGKKLRRTIHSRS